MNQSLEGKVCIVSGASRGIGKAIAELFLAEGAKLYCLSRTGPEVSSGPVAPDGATGPDGAATPPVGPSVWIPCDVADETAVDAAVAQVLAAEGRIDVLVNNAGVTRDGLLMRMKTEDWDTVIKTNLTSAFYLSRAVSRHMLKQRSGAILNVSSVVGISGNAGQANYAASKAGIIGFTKSLAREFAPRGVRVNAIAPGFIETAMTDRIPEEFKARLKETIPLGRVGSPGETAAAALFLCSSSASYITGVVLNVDGGMGM
ncbi:MAG: 3-oxoacyl-[acyl-carrier-protein] reductase [Rectinemataceae bacterium]